MPLRNSRIPLLWKLSAIQTRMADALEDLVVLQMPDVTEPMAGFAQVPSGKSPMYDTLEHRWKQGRMSEAMLRLYVRKGCITADLSMTRS